MDKNTNITQTTYKTSEVARELGISAEWLRKGEERGFFPPPAAIPTAATATTPGRTWSVFAVGEKDFARRPPMARPSGRATPKSTALTTRIEKLALEERDAVRRRDWPAARSAAEERATLQEAQHRAAARRLA